MQTYNTIPQEDYFEVTQNVWAIDGVKISNMTKAASDLLYQLDILLPSHTRTTTLREKIEEALQETDREIDGLNSRVNPLQPSRQKLLDQLKEIRKMLTDTKFVRSLSFNVETSFQENTGYDG